MISEVVDAEFKVERRFRSHGELGELFAALAKAQGQIVNPKKDADNPYFKSKYTDLAGIIDAIKKPFADNGLAYLQFLRRTADGIEVETLIGHGATGSWISDTLGIPVAKQDAQALGSATSYGKRYSLQSMAGLTGEEDDDGNAAAASTAQQRSKANDSKLDPRPVNPKKPAKMVDETYDNAVKAFQLAPDAVTIDKYLQAAKAKFTKEQFTCLELIARERNQELLAELDEAESEARLI